MKTPLSRPDIIAIRALYGNDPITTQEREYLRRLIEQMCAYSPKMEGEAVENAQRMEMGQRALES